MLDELVNEPKKRLLASLLLLEFLGILVALVNLKFGMAIFNAHGFAKVVAVLSSDTQSFFSYFFFQAVSTYPLYAKFTGLLIIKTILLIFNALNFVDYIMLLFIIALLFLHTTRQSRISLAINAGHFVLSGILLIGLTILLLSAYNAASANSGLMYIHIAGIVLIFFEAFCMAVHLIWFVRLLKQYLALFQDENI